MDLLLKILDWFVAKSDPVLIVCVLILGYWQRSTSAKLEKHINPDPETNPYPHPQCKVGEIAYGNLCKSLEKQHIENREDHQEMFRLLRGEKE